ncbi:iron dicitrate transporter FecR [Azorhizobium oxalatiphilum]|uniref:Iron dicitrate transporter FecR n=1 Tax=Azorhizobium oxalatiphilum TaxID=980631 RepID=A0A917C7U3_9HYPH|nr:FecR family protein [Azorhizobium oxalatiphilum]GGF74753.1 iron dicitrate transporter FecR [Azorhizobium oxalatiphilum]
MPARQATRAQKRRHEEAADWLLRNREAEGSPAAQAAFQLWLAQDPDNARVYAAAERLMGDASRAISSDSALRDFTVPSRSVAKPLLGVALLAGLAGVLFVAMDGPMRLQADAMSGPGEMPVLTLADGSHVQLNTSSAIAYDMAGERRIVRLLRGQAYFEVARDPGRPFTVEADDARVTALGTAFDVRLGQTETEVTVTEHAVMVDFPDGAHAGTRVTQGERAVFEDGVRAVAVSPSDPTTALAWRRGQLVMNGMPLSNVLEEVNRHFPGRIIIAGADLGRRRVSGTMNIRDTDAALAFIEYALKVSTVRIGPLIILRD